MRRNVQELERQEERILNGGELLTTLVYNESSAVQPQSFKVHVSI